MSNPEFKSMCSESTIRLANGKSNVVITFLKAPDGYYRLHLDKPNVLRLITELQSWHDTNEFVKPKRQFIFTYQYDGADCYPFKAIGAHDFEEAKQKFRDRQERHQSDWVHAWELKLEDAIKP